MILKTVMHYYIVALATVFALFWDEALIGIYTLWFGKTMNRKFIICWMILSGVITSVLVSLHVPLHYRIVTIVLISSAILFSANGYFRYKLPENPIARK